MKLLIVTQKVDRNDPILGFFHRWLLEFAKNVDKLTVICLEKGEYDLPNNVEVHSLGKEEGVSRLHYVYRFYKYIFKFRNEYDSVFVHMNQVYVVLGGIFWRMIGKKISLWYTHKSVTLSLRFATKLVDVVFSAAKESFNLKTNKLKILGHGIDINNLECINRGPIGNPLRILVVGRITEIKGIKEIIEACNILKDENVPFRLSFVGDPITKTDFVYLEEVKGLIKKYSLETQIYFEGSVPNYLIREKYCDADIMINPLPTGGLDKVVIEAMTSGVIPFTSNKAFSGYFGGYASDLIFQHEDSGDLANKIIKFLEKIDVLVVRSFMVDMAKEKFNMSSLIKNILENLNK